VKIEVTIWENNQTIAKDIRSFLDVCAEYFGDERIVKIVQDWIDHRKLLIESKMTFLDIAEKKAKDIEKEIGNPFKEG